MVQEDLQFRIFTYEKGIQKLNENNVWKGDTNGICKAIGKINNSIAKLLNAFLIVALNNSNAIIGAYIITQRINPKLNEEGEFYCKNRDYCWYIDFLCVLQEHKGKNYGRKILDGLDKVIPQLNQNPTIQFNSNKVSLSPIDETEDFYTKCGFEEDGVVWCKNIRQS